MKRPAGEVCPLCGGEGNPSIFHGRHIRECCGVLLAWPHQSRAAYEEQYASGYHDEEMIRTQRKTFVERDAEYLVTAARRLQKIRLLYPNAFTLLDVGCGTGSLVANAPAYAFRSEGVEPSPVMTAWASRIGRKVSCGTWDEVEGLWDVVTLYDVLEHLLDPLAALEHLRARLRYDGVLVVEMPEFDAPDGDWTRHIKPAEHPCLYSCQAALTLFDRAGLRWDCIDRPLESSLGKVCFYLRPKE